jgi:hypothetical protein
MEPVFINALNEVMAINTITAPHCTMLPRNDGILQLPVAFYLETKGEMLEQMNNLFKRLVPFCWIIAFLP